MLSNWRSSEEFDGYPFKFNVSSSLPIQWVYLYHNTCYTAVPGQHAFWFKQYSNWTNVISRNNIFSGTDYALESQSNVANSVDFDYDAFFTTKAAPVITWGGVRYNTLGQFAAAVGEETHGIWAMPAFIDPAVYDYYLRTNSALIDKGVSIPGINDDPLRAAPDIGALEFGMEAKRITTGTNGVVIDWHVGVFGKYQFQYTTNLSQGTWNQMGAPIEAEQPILELTDPLSANGQRFYRLEHIAP